MNENDKLNKAKKDYFYYGFMSACGTILIAMIILILNKYEII